ncbi:hypothetical protein TRSC58_02670 [Trypanosoma rangeli SC58]|uniref:Uncharacterized protein n=1 Tax=Trypanosoma rangeli SC58 TaxID=429131 RepID=A0A061J8M5_TRYRA|nr:hypothetical protein TRSC58_02670 [Trypanosoma rangeli SC58]
MEGRIGAVFIIIQLSDGPIDLLDFFHRAWNAELLRNAASEPTVCLLRFPLLRVNDTVCSGVVASVLASGLVRVASSGSIEAALAIADFVNAYVIRRLAPLPRRTGTKSIALLQVFLSPAPPLPNGTSVDTSEGSAAWLRERIASSTAAAGRGGDGVGPHVTQWWCCLKESSVTALRYRHTLRIVCHFRQLPPLQVGRELGPAVGRGLDDRDADAFFLGSELMSVVPLGSVFVAVGHNPEKVSDHSMRASGGEKEGRRHKRLRCESEARAPESLSLASSVGEDVVALMTPPSSFLTPSTAAQAAHTVLPAAGAVTEACPLVAKSQLKVETILYRSGRVFATTDSVEALSFVVEELLLPLMQRHQGD